MWLGATDMITERAHFGSVRGIFTQRHGQAGRAVAGPGALYRVYWDDDALVAVTEWVKGAVCGVDEARQVTTDLAALSLGPVPLLVDMRGMAKLERGAREHFISEQTGVTAIALLAGSAVNKMIANFFIGLQRMPVPIRIFTDRAQALGWLGEHQ